MDNNKNLDAGFWNDRYKAGDTGWDMGQVSPPLKGYIDQLANKDIRVLIPGCGNAYEADYLLSRGFTNITLLDVAPLLVMKLRKTFHNREGLRIVLGDFFSHQGEYDLILEQTFFCALEPSFRKAYRDKMLSLLTPGGTLAGVLFNTNFEKEGPPFGGSQKEYRDLFSGHFGKVRIKPCYNSHPKRAENEVFMILKKSYFM